MLQSSDPETVKAIKLCRSYLPPKKLPTKHSTSTSLVWKKNTPSATPTADVAGLAVEVLGNKLVDSIQETHRATPDVCFLAQIYRKISYKYPNCAGKFPTKPYKYPNCAGKFPTKPTNISEQLL